MAEIEVRMAIDPFKVVGKALVGAKEIKVRARSTCHICMKRIKAL
jgi:hypothetical protein